METIIYQIIGLACLTHLWVCSSPTTYLRRLLGFKQENYDKYSDFKQVVHTLLGCSLCMGFWIGLGQTGSLMTAAIVSLLAEFLYRKLN